MTQVATPQPTPTPGVVRGPETVLFEGRPALVPGVGSLVLAVVTLGLALIYYWFKRGGLSYRITDQRIVIDRGLLSKRMEQVDLYRIDDFSVDRPVGQRILGTGNLRLHTFDKSLPILELNALSTDVVALYEQLRVAVENAKQLRGVRVLDLE